MSVYTKILGNIAEPLWAERQKECEVEYIALDQWMAQKSRFVAQGDRGGEYAVALARGTHLRDGDVIRYESDHRLMAIIRLRLSDIMVIDLGALTRLEPEVIIHIAIELGHALGNQHWPAVVHSTELYVPMTTDRKVMESVMRTHAIPHIAYSFRSAEQITPYLSPSEVRQLLGGTTEAQSAADKSVEHAHHHK